MIHRRKDRRCRAIVATAVALCLLAGCGTSGGEPHRGETSPGSSAPVPATPSPARNNLGNMSEPTSEPVLRKPRPVMNESPPVSLTIPALDRESEIIATGLREDRSLEVPPGYEGAPASWFKGSPTPGERGPAVLLGHVNSTEDDSGVFYNLDELESGDSIAITREDGSQAVFEVYKSEIYAKDDFPTRAVYSPTQGAELRLITCDGFTPASGQFVKNLVVYAKLTNTA